MPLSRGPSDLVDRYRGSTAITAVYLGGEQIWPAESSVGVGAFSMAVSFQEVALLKGWVEVDPLPLAATLQDVSISLQEGMGVSSLSLAIVLQDVTTYISAIESGSISARVTLPDVTLTLGSLADNLLTSGDMQSGSDVIILSGDESGNTLILSET